MEKVAHEQLSEYLINNNILVKNQSGFRSKHSCESALQLTVTNWKQAIDNNKYTIAVFVDLKRAFETIDRSILMTKIKKCGIGGRVFDWLNDYLLNRFQKTKVKSKFSNVIATNFGVPQGSTLGPLLFLIY